jgi:hypothetical protein
MHAVALFLHAGSLGYIDPNAGGWLFQMLFPVFVAIGGAWLVLRRKVGALFRRVFGPKDKKTDDRK